MNRLNHALLHLAGLLVREPDRSAWRADWESELWYVVRDSNQPDRTALRFCLGAFRDALWLRCNGTVPQRRQFFHWESPTRCLTYLAVTAAAVTALFFRIHTVIDAVFQHLQGRRDLNFQGLVSINLLFVAVALAILPTTTSLSLGEYPSKKIRRWIFLLSKVALVLPIAFFGTLDLVPVFPFPLLADLWLLGYVLALRWAITDQRQRCPVCLRLLANPARFGEASHTLLDWYGTEFFCTRGHGLLHVPENRTSYSTQRWLDLDPSWRSLFSSQSN